MFLQRLTDQRAAVACVPLLLVVTVLLVSMPLRSQHFEGTPAALDVRMLDARPAELTVSRTPPLPQRQPENAYFVAALSMTKTSAVKSLCSLLQGRQSHG